MVVQEPITVAAVSPTSISFEQTIIPATGQIEWIFRWKTSGWTSPDQDQVKLKTATSACGYAVPKYLAAGDPDVTVEPPLYAVDRTTGAVAYEHVLRYDGWICQTGCQSTYEVSSGGGSWVAASRAIKITVCPQY